MATDTATAMKFGHCEPVILPEGSYRIVAGRLFVAASHYEDPYGNCLWSVMAKLGGGSEITILGEQREGVMTFLAGVEGVELERIEQ